MTDVSKNTPIIKEGHENPFLKTTHKDINQGTVAIEESRAIAEAQGKLVIAKKFPRDQAAAFEMIITSCSRKALAEAAMYSYPKGGAVVRGPSIRLAEELARAWGNIDYGIRELSQKNGVSELEAYCWDLETNTMSSQKFTVKHERHTSSGIKVLTDPRDIYEATANYAARRLRARILAILPPDLVESAVAECAKTLAGGNSEPLQDRVRKMLRKFSEYGVKAEHIEKRIGKKLDDILVDELVDLTTIYNSIKENVTKPSDWFNDYSFIEVPETPQTIQQLNLKVKGGKGPDLNEELV